MRSHSNRNRASAGLARSREQILLNPYWAHLAHSNRGGTHSEATHTREAALQNHAGDHVHPPSAIE